MGNLRYALILLGELQTDLALNYDVDAKVFEKLAKTYALVERALGATESDKESPLSFDEVD